MISGSKRYKIIKDLTPITRYGCNLRLVNESDAEFIYQLRTNPKLAKFLNPVSGTVEDQRNWIKEYKKRETEGNDFYFVDVDPDNVNKAGLVRMCNFTGPTFESGSWVYLPDLDLNRAILGDILLKEIGFDILDFEYCVFYTEKNNKSVIKYEQIFSPEFIQEDDRFYYYKISKGNFNLNKRKILKIHGF